MWWKTNTSKKNKYGKNIPHPEGPTKAKISSKWRMETIIVSSITVASDEVQIKTEESNRK